MTRPVRLGVLTPSSNTVVEPVSAAIAAGLHAFDLVAADFVDLARRLGC